MGAISIIDFPGDQKKYLKITVYWERKKKVPINPGKVLMKDTQGIVSSEAACYSCHDGCAVDSPMWKHQSRTTFKKPAWYIRIPLTLNVHISISPL